MDFIQGTICMGFAVGGLFFLRFWRQTRDRLFLIFAFAFWIFALGRILMAVAGDDTEKHAYIYMLRLAGFLFIIIAIVDKNRSHRTEKQPAKGADLGP